MIKKCLLLLFVVILAVSVIPGSAAAEGDIAHA